MSIFFELLLPCFVNLASLYVAGTGNQLWLVSSLRLVGKIPIGGNISMISMSYWSSQPHYSCILDIYLFSNLDCSMASSCLSLLFVRDDDFCFVIMIFFLGCSFPMFFFLVFMVKSNSLEDNSSNVNQKKLCVTQVSASLPNLEACLEERRKNWVARLLSGAQAVGLSSSRAFCMGSKEIGPP